MGGGVKKTDKNSQFQFGNVENPGGGLDFSKMSELRIRLRPNPRKENRKLNMAYGPVWSRMVMYGPLWYRMVL